jgi:hypothetical protein
MSRNIFPKAYGSLVHLAVKAAAGAAHLGAEIGLAHHTPERIAGDLYAVIGNPESPETPGLQMELNAQLRAVKVAYETVRATTAAGQEFCRSGIGLLKGVLGTSYNSAWQNAGFLARTLRVPRNPVTMLIEFRQYLTANPANENAAAGVTAERAQMLFAAMESAARSVAAAKAAQIHAKRARDRALRTLKKRMSGLRAELEQVLSPDDGRWLEFGFQVPGGGEIPERVQGVVVSPGATGSVSVSWESARLATKYRVSWRTGDHADEIAAGLHSDTQAVIRGVPDGREIIVRVTARNRSGESAASEAALTLPVLGQVVSHSQDRLAVG